MYTGGQISRTPPVTTGIAHTAYIVGNGVLYALQGQEPRERQKGVKVAIRDVLYSHAPCALLRQGRFPQSRQNYRPLPH